MKEASLVSSDSQRSNSLSGTLNEPFGHLTDFAYCFWVSTYIIREIGQSRLESNRTERFGYSLSVSSMLLIVPLVSANLRFTRYEKPSELWIRTHSESFRSPEAWGWAPSVFLSSAWVAKSFLEPLCLRTYWIEKAKKKLILWRSVVYLLKNVWIRDKGDYSEVGFKRVLTSCWQLMIGSMVTWC